MDIATAFFQVASASSTTGLSIIDLTSLEVNVKVLFIALMFIGGCAFSTAGGVKVLRILMFVKSIPWVVRGIVTGELGKLTFGGKEINTADILSYWLIIILAPIVTFTFAFVFTLYGFSFVDSVFELTSAFATTGLSVGITSVSLPVILKLILALMMLLGRIEFVAFLVAVTPVDKASIPEPPPVVPNGKNGIRLPLLKKGGSNRKNEREQASSVDK
jgi:trk system potassium uptake protein TrkH